MNLRDEIIESQKARADLFKWKIILVAAIGAAGLGVGAPKAEVASKVEYVLCLIPLVCVYTDVLCAHLNLRIRVIGEFLRVTRNRAGLTDEDLNADYEKFAGKARHMGSLPISLPISAIRHRIEVALRRWTRAAMTKLGLTLNEAETSVKDAPTLDAFVFEDYALHVTTMALSLFVFILGVLIHYGYVAVSLSSLREEAGMFYIAGGLGVAATAGALLAYHRRLAAIEELADREIEPQQRTPQPLAE